MGEAAYNYAIEFIPGKQNMYADFLSRRPTDANPSQEEEVIGCYVYWRRSVCTCIYGCQGDEKDPVLSKVPHLTQYRWPEKPEALFQPYHNMRLELT